MTHPPRIYITGASCAGVSTLGAALAGVLGLPQIDVDDVYWMPTDPPFTTKRPPEDRVRLIQDQQAGSGGWVLTGSFVGWGDVLIVAADLIVFVETPTPVRLQRLDRREAERHGARILPGGDMHLSHLAFRDWAARYDDPAFTGRNRAQHAHWLARQTVPVLHLDGDNTAMALRDSVMDRLTQVRAQTRPVTAR